MVTRFLQTGEGVQTEQMAFFLLEAAVLVVENDEEVLPFPLDRRRRPGPFVKRCHLAQPLVFQEAVVSSRSDLSPAAMLLPTGAGSDTTKWRPGPNPEPEPERAVPGLVFTQTPPSPPSPLAPPPAACQPAAQGSGDPGRL